MVSHSASVVNIMYYLILRSPCFLLKLIKWKFIECIHILYSKWQYIFARVVFKKNWGSFLGQLLSHRILYWEYDSVSFPFEKENFFFLTVALVKKEASLAYNSQPSVIVKDKQFLRSKDVCAEILIIFVFLRIPSSLAPPSSLEPVQYCWLCLLPCLFRNIPI